MRFNFFLCETKTPSLSIWKGFHAKLWVAEPPPRNLFVYFFLLRCRLTRGGTSLGSGSKAWDKFLARSKKAPSSSSLIFRKAWSSTISDFVFVFSKKLGLKAGSRDILTGLGSSELDAQSSISAQAHKNWAHSTSCQTIFWSKYSSSSLLKC